MRTLFLDKPSLAGREVAFFSILGVSFFFALSAAASPSTGTNPTYRPIHWGTVALFVAIIPLEAAILAKIVGKPVGEALVPTAVVNCVSTLPWFLVAIEWIPYRETHISLLAAKLTIKGFPQFNHFLMFAFAGFLIALVIEGTILFFWWHKYPARRTFAAVACANLVTVALVMGFMIFFPGSSFVSNQPRPY